MTTTPAALAAATSFDWLGHKKPDVLEALVGELERQSAAIHSGQLARAEAMLIAQAHTLDAIFNNLASRANKSELMQQLEMYLRLALKAQSQCRTTLETLAAMKNPPQVAFVRQANIAGGHQQVNNGMSARAEPNFEPNKLLKGTPDGSERLEQGATCTTATADSSMEAVGKIDRPANGRRKIARRA